MKTAKTIWDSDRSHRATGVVDWSRTKSGAGRSTAIKFRWRIWGSKAIDNLPLSMFAPPARMVPCEIRLLLLA